MTFLHAKSFLSERWKTIPIVSSVVYLPGLLSLSSSCWSLSVPSYSTSVWMSPPVCPSNWFSMKARLAFPHRHNNSTSYQGLSWNEAMDAFSSLWAAKYNSGCDRSSFCLELQTYMILSLCYQADTNTSIGFLHIKHSTIYWDFMKHVACKLNFVHFLGRA